MSLFQEDGVLTSRTSAGTDVVTLTGSGASLDVKLVRLVLNGATATGGANADYVFSFGWSDGTNDRAIGWFSQDNVGTSVSKRIQDSDGAIVVVDSSGTQIDVATISSVGTGTFTINWSIKSGTAYKVGWTAFGGTDITEVEVGSFSVDTTTGAHTQAVTSTIKSADFGMFYHVIKTNQVASGTPLGSIGMSDGTNHGVLAIYSQGGAGTSDTYRYQRTNASISNMVTGSLNGDASTTFDASDGIQVAWDANKNASIYDVYYVLVKGGRWEVGSGTTHTSAATKSYTTAFQPVGVSTISANNTTSASVVAENHLSIGSTDGTTSYSFSAGDNDAKGTTETGTYHSTANVVQTFTATELTAGGGIASLVGAGTFDSFNATDFTLDFTGNADSALREFIWLVCAAELSGGVVNRLAGEGGLAGMGGIAGLHGGLAG